VLGDDLMAYRSVVLTAEQFSHERLYAESSVSAPDVSAGDDVLLVAAIEPPVAFGVGHAVAAGSVTYVLKSIDDPVPVDAALLTGDEVDAATFSAVAERLRPAPTAERVWMVSLDLPIEAPTSAEAVRRFWSYVRELGPVELPTYVSPAGDELAMRAFVLGEEVNQDPEEE
jgi:hypothetical protein